MLNFLDTLTKRSFVYEFISTVKFIYHNYMLLHETILQMLYIKEKIQQ